jgi:hypothetical protein
VITTKACFDLEQKSQTLLWKVIDPFLSSVQSQCIKKRIAKLRLCNALWLNTKVFIPSPVCRGAG